jgi:hypothetical protein
VTYYPNSIPRTLSDSHRRMLFEESGIDPGVAAERGYYTARKRSEVPKAFKDYQRRLGLVVPTYSPDARTVGTQLRPNRPRKDGLKYESPQGSGVILDVHPRALQEVRAGDGNLFVVEGCKKGDALVSRGVAVVTLTSVWMAHVPKSKPKRLLPCWDHIRLAERRVFIIFDSDWKRKENVHDAQEWLVGALEDRGADVRVAYLEDAPDGKKVGVDDFLVAGGTVAELKALCRKFERQDTAQIRLAKDEKLRAAVEDLKRRWWDEEWKGRGGHTERDIALKLIEAAARSGKIHPDGLRVKVSWGTLQVGAKVARRTLSKAIGRLEERGFMYRDNEGRKPDKTGAFVLRAKVDQYRERATSEGKATQGSHVCNPGGLPLRGLPNVSRLRWSRPRYAPRRGLVSGTRMVRSSKPLPPRARIERLGKIRGAVVDALEIAGGTLTLAELCDALHHKRPRDVRRRILPMLVDAGIVEVEGHVLYLAANWSERLQAARVAGGELEADELAERRRKLNSCAYHNRNETSKSRPSAAGLKAIKRCHAQRQAGLAAIEERATAATKTEELRKAQVFVRDRLRELGRIRFALLQDIWHDEGGDPWTIPQAVEALGCRVEELPEFDNRRFVFAPAEGAA